MSISAIATTAVPPQKPQVTEASGGNDHDADDGGSAPVSAQTPPAAASANKLVDVTA